MVQEYPWLFRFIVKIEENCMILNMKFGKFDCQKKSVAKLTYHQPNFTIGKLYQFQKLNLISQEEGRRRYERERRDRDRERTVRRSR